MFRHKRNVLPPRPEPPTAEEILEDLKNTANKSDVAFRPFSKGKNDLILSILLND